MARRHRGSGSPVRFFAFQDVMIGTIGVVLVVTLLLLLQIGRAAVARIEPVSPEPDIAQATGVAIPSDTADQRAALAVLTQNILEADDTLRSLRRRIDATKSDKQSARLSAMRDGDVQVAKLLLADQDELRRDIETMRNRRLVYLIANQETRPIVAELAAGRCVVSTDQANDPPIAIRQSDPEQIATGLLSWYRGQSDLSDRHLLIVLKPSGLPIWEALQRQIKTDPALRNLSMGLDLIPESASTTRFPAE